MLEPIAADLAHGGETGPRGCRVVPVWQVRLEPMDSATDAKETLLRATGRGTIDEALDWLVADHPVVDDTGPRELLQAVIQLGPDAPKTTDVVRRLTRSLAKSELDTAAVLFAIEEVSKPSEFRKVLDLLAGKCPNGSLAEITPSAVIATQRENRFTVEALCSLAGLTYGDLRARVQEELPANANDHWSAPQVRLAFEVIDAIVGGRFETDVPGAHAARPLELMPELMGEMAGSGWAAIETMRRGGVPYEVLLAQRSGGGAWLAHRNRTSSKITHSIASRLCGLLEERGIEYRRSAAVGGSTKPSVIHELTGAGKQVGVVPVDRRGKALCGVIFSVARDSGTASKNAGRLRTMPRSSELPLLLLLAGAGWAARNETADLAIAFEGRVYAERNAAAAADAIEKLVRNTSDSGGGTR